MTCAGVHSGGRTKVQVLQEKSVPTDTPCKRKKRFKTVLNASLEDDNEHEPPRKKSRRADPPTKRYAVLFHDQPLQPPLSWHIVFVLKYELFLAYVV
jgi:hypothetical protein